MPRQKKADNPAKKRTPGRSKNSTAPEESSRGDATEHEAEHEDGAEDGDADGAELSDASDVDGHDGDGAALESGDLPLEEEADAGASHSKSEKSESPGAARAPHAIERFDAMAAYQREIQRYPLLTPEETHALAVRFLETQDSKLAARMVTANLRLVVKIAYEYRRAYKNIMDLVQEGNIGLMQAVKRYDPYRNVKLSSYAAFWIRAYILRFILNNWRLVKLGTTQAQRKLFFNLRKKSAQLAALGIDPTHAEIAKQLNVPEADVAEMDVRLTSSEKSLDAPVGDSDGRSIAKVDTMPSLVEGPEALLAGGELQALLKKNLGEFRKTLDGKEKELAIFDDRLVADDPLTLQELGNRFGISRERVRQLEQRLTEHLREYLQDRMGDATELD